MFIVKKLNEIFYICIDYRILNFLIIKNRNTFLLIQEILIKLCAIKNFNKFNIIATFNKIRIKEKNKIKNFFFI